MKLHERDRFLFLDNGKRITECSPLHGWSLETKEDVIADFHSGKTPSTNALKFAIESLSITQHTLEGIERSSLGATKGIRSKIKIHTPNISQALETIENAYHISGFPVRVDCNQKWDYESASTLIKEIDHTMIEYIEEPTSNYIDNLTLASTIPVALDETLLHNLHLVQEPSAFVFVLKPTLLGPIEPYLSLQPQKSVLSGAYESGIGTRYILNLAKEYPEIAPGVGIGTYRSIDDPVFPPLSESTTWEFSLPS